MSKKLKIIIFIFILILGFNIWMRYNYNEPVQKINENERIVDKYFCEVDEDCIAKYTDCECCPSMYTCVNKNWQPDCPDNQDFCAVSSCLPPAPPWFNECKCINNICNNCREDKCKQE